MTVEFLVRVELDDATVAALSSRNYRPARTLEELIADIERRLVDAPRHMETVSAVRITLVNDFRPEGVA